MAIQAQLNAPQGVAVDATGNVYIVDKENHRIRRVRPDGIITTFAGTGLPGFSGDGAPASQARLNNPLGVAVDAAGNVYIADAASQRVRRVGPDGIIRTVAGSGVGGFSGDGGLATQASLSGPFGIAVDGTGSLYIADDGNRRVRRVRPDGIITTVAGSGPIGGPDVGGFSGDGGPATQARLGRATGVAVDTKGNIYIADYNNQRIRRVGPDGIIVTYAGSGFSTGPSGDGIPATQANLFNPNGVAVDASGNLYIAEHGNSRVSRVSPDGLFITYAGTGPPSTSTIGDSGPANRATLSGPQGVAADAKGNVYIAEEWGHRIRKVTADGAQPPPPTTTGPGIITAFAGTGDPGFSGDGGPATQARLNWPQGVAVDAQENAYICDSINNRVRRVGADGMIVTFAGAGPTGSGQGGFSGNGGPATQARISNPTGVTVDAKGYVYIAEGGHVRRVGPDGIITTFVDVPAVGVAIDVQGNLYTADGSRIRRVSQDGVVTTIAGPGRQDFLGDGGPATQASFKNAYSVAVDAKGIVYVVDSGNNRVRRVGLDGLITTFAGTGMNSSSGDGGPATQASLVSPYDVTLDISGFVYISEVGRIRRVGTAGIITTVAGSGSGGSFGDGGPATQAGLGLAQGIAVDAKGFIYISDTSNHSVRRVSPGGSAQPPSPPGPVTPPGPSAAPAISWSPPSLSFGDVQVGQNKTLNLSISNTGNAALTASGITVTGTDAAQFTVSPTTFTVNPGATAQTLTVTFTPSSAGSKSAYLSIAHNAFGSPSSIALIGNGTVPVKPKIEVFPSLINFGAVTLGQTKSVTIEVSNVGGGTLRVANIVFSSPDFSVDATSFSLRTGEKKTLIITFSPSKAANVNETLDIPSDDPDARLTQISIRATVRQSTAGPAIAVQVNALDFGQVDFGRSVDLNLPIRNEGTGPLNISNITSDNVQVTVTPTSLVIQAGQSRTVTVTYKPQPLRERSGGLRITSDDPAQPTIKVPWAASEVVTGKALTVTEASPASGAVGVSLKTELVVTFSEPVFARKGFIAVDASLFPAPASGDLLSQARAEDGGRKVVFPVELKTATFYRFVLFGATSVSGAELDKTYSLSFTTDVSRPAVGSIAGAVSLSGGTLPRTAVLLFDQKGMQVAQGGAGGDGKYEFSNLAAGQYYVYAQGDLPDGRRASGASARNPVTLAAGQALAGVDVAMRVVDQAAPGANPAAGVSLDLDPARGNQKSASLGGVQPGQQIALAVYAEGVKDLIGYAVGVEYDTAQVSFVGSDAETGEEKNILNTSGGTMLFIKQPPKGNVVSIGGALLSPTSATAPDGGGLLSVLKFVAQEGFSSGAEFRIPRVVFRGLSGRDTVEVNAQASVSTQVSPPPSVGPLTPKAGDGTGTLGVKDEKTRILGGVKPGQQVDVFVVLGQEVSGSNAFQAVLTFDPKKLKVVSGKGAGVFASAIFPGPPQVKDNTVTYAGAFLGSTVTAKGMLAVIAFEALGDFSGETEVVLAGLSIRVSGQSKDFKPGASVVLNSGGAGGGSPSPDFDGDGDVGFNDFFLFAGGFGQKAEGENAKFDLDGDGDVGFGDFFAFAGAFGQKAGKPSAVRRGQATTP